MKLYDPDKMVPVRDLIITLAKGFIEGEKLNERQFSLELEVKSTGFKTSHSFDVSFKGMKIPNGFHIKDLIIR